MKRTLICLGLIVTMNVSAETGETLHNQNCVACHDSSVYTREDRTVLSMEQLNARVDRCGHKAAKVDWTDEQYQTVKNYYQTMAFVNALAWIAHKEDHHPDLEVSYRECKVRYSTHAIGGLSENDFICAAKVDALVSGD